MREEPGQTGANGAGPTDIARGLPALSLPDETPATDETPKICIDEPTAMQVFVVWEKLRIFYNAVLVILVLLKVRFVDDDFGLETLIPGAVIANVCFCAGPVVEGYLNWLGLPRSIIRPLIFWIGMLLAMGLASITRARDLGPAFH